jgi:nickel/cobalt transporter (NiCoT) family protein
LAKLTESSVGLLSKEKVTIIAFYSVIATIIVFGLIASTLVGHTYVVLAGLGLLAFVLGLQHGVDADHIAAIDNTTRKLLQEGKRPLTVGMWFSLGHSTLVVALIAAFVVATKEVAGAIPLFQSTGALVGSLVSGVFLFIIGLTNVIIVRDVYRIFSGLKQGKLSQAELDNELNKKGFMNKRLGKLFKIVQAPWQMYAVGLLFGLGFETASQAALIALGVGLGVSSNVPVWMILIVPLMFTAGMVLVDTSDGISMRLAYGWAFLKPMRKIFYNLTLTIISVLVAFLVGGIELTQVLSVELGLTGGFWALLRNLDFEVLGFGIVGIFLTSWLVAMAYYRYKGFDKNAFLKTDTLIRDSTLTLDKKI